MRKKNRVVIEGNRKCPRTVLISVKESQICETTESSERVPYLTRQQNELGIEQCQQRGEFHLQPESLEYRAEHYTVR